MTARIRPILVSTVALLGTATVLVAVAPSLSFAYRAPTAHTTIETAGTVAAALAAFILFGRVRETRSRAELFLFVGLLMLFAANLARFFAPSFDGTNEAVVWVPLSANLGAAAVLVAAAFSSAEEVPPREASRVTVAVLLGAGLLMASAAVLSAGLPVGIDPGVSPTAADGPLVVGAPGLLVAQLASMALYGAAAAGFARRAELRADEFLAWLALGLALLALARLNYFLFPSIYAEWMFIGDLLRLGAYLAILAGALRQIAAYQHAAARAAVLEDRSRIARDLHDSLAQDLAFIAMQGERIATTDERGAQLAETARMALATSRGAIEHLRRSDDPLGPALARMATALAARHDVRLALDVEEGVETTPEARDELLRVAGEAISNSVRHGEAAEIRIGLAAEPGVGIRLLIADDGRGFDPDELSPANGGGGLGLEGVRERARRLGGRCRISSRHGQGTTVEVVIP